MVIAAGLLCVVGLSGEILSTDEDAVILSDEGFRALFIQFARTPPIRDRNGSDDNCCTRRNLNFRADSLAA